MPKIINNIKMEPFNLIKNIDAQYELWGKKKPPTWMRGCVVQRIIRVFPIVDM